MRNIALPAALGIVFLAALIYSQTSGNSADARQDADPAAPTAQPEPRTVQQVPIDGIDWGQAQADMAAQVNRAAESGMAQVASAGEAAPVPVLLPTGLVRPESAGPPLYIATEDGYFANIPGLRYDIIMNGTIARFDNPNEAGTTKDEEGYTFSATDAGAQVSLSRYGADYVIEFECQILNEEGTCITEEDAIEIAESLVVSRGQ